MGECCDGKCHQDLVWRNFGMVSVIRFWYGRLLLWEGISGSGMEEFCYCK